MNLSLNSLTENPLGRAVYRPFQAVLHGARRIAYPGVPHGHEVIRAAYGGRQFQIEVRRWNASDRMAVEQCFTEAQYDVPWGAHGEYAAQLYRGIVDSGRKPLIVDCGANIGASVLWFSARYPEAHIVAVEPAPDNFALLRKNCAGVNADLRMAGIGGADGTARLSRTFGGEMGYRVCEDGGGVEVTVLSMETLLAGMPESEYRPFLLKVDIEGAEKSMFAGSAAVLDQFPIIIMEPHDWMLPGEQTSVEFFRFHAQAGREFSMRNENVVSIAHHPGLRQCAVTPPPALAKVG